MSSIIGAAIADGLLVTVFVAVMMIVIEYLSVLTQGAFQRTLNRSHAGKYLIAVLLGATPGCLGAFTVVALYGHRLLPIGAVVAAMIATSGDEAFVMFALFPSTALWLTVGLAAIGMAVGPIVDLLVKERPAIDSCDHLVLHSPETCRCFSISEILEHWRRPSGARVALAGALLMFIVAVALGILGPQDWTWIRVLLLAVGLFAFFVVTTVPDHFLQTHLWRHVAVKHVPRILIWTVSVLVLVALAGAHLELPSLMQENSWLVMVAAALVGMVPESGPHLVFVTLFDDGLIPLSILVASSIVQDGHGMLPLLADSRRDFILIKCINLLIGLAVGALLLGLGS